MEFKVSANQVKIAPRKIRLVAGLVRGKHMQDAFAALSTCNKKSGRVIEKLLKSAVANASHTSQVASDALRVAMIRVDGGPVLKRYDSRAMGKAEVIRKRMSNIHVTLSDSPKR